MRYVLIIAFNFDRYKDSTSHLKIFSKDRLLYHKTLDEDIGDKIFTSTNHTLGLYNKQKATPMLYKRMREKWAKSHGLDDSHLIQFEQNDDPTYIKQHKEKKWNLPKKFTILHLKDEDIGDEVTIDCDIQGNNYTNGFMTKSSYITFRTMMLIPESCLTEHSVRYIFPRLFKNEWLMQAYYEGRQGWPTPGIVVMEKEGTKKQMDHSIIRGGSPIGGQFKLQIPVVEKHRVKFFGNKNSSKGRILFDASLMTYIKCYNLLNITNEDQ